MCAFICVCVFVLVEVTRLHFCYKMNAKEVASFFCTSSSYISWPNDRGLTESFSGSSHNFWSFTWPCKSLPTSYQSKYRGKYFFSMIHQSREYSTTKMSLKSNTEIAYASVVLPRLAEPLFQRSFQYQSITIWNAQHALALAWDDYGYRLSFRKDRSNSQPLQSFRVPIRLSFHISMTYWL